MKNFLTFIKENNQNITVPDVSWLYFLHWVYGGKLPIKVWKNDKRMGVNCLDSLKKFDCVTITDDMILSSPECEKIIDEYFSAKTFEETLKLKKDLVKYDISGYSGYNISRIPRDLYLRKYPNVDKNFDRIKERIIYHYNSQISSEKIIKKLASSRDLKKWNLMKIYEIFNEIPEKITIYRGLKDDYDPDDYHTYSCWTTSRSQGERFAKYVFTGMFQGPILSNKQILLVAEININDALVVVGGDESEIIMKNPVEIKKIINLKV